MILLRLILIYAAGWALSLLILAMMGKKKALHPTCKCGDDFRIWGKYKAILVLIFLPLSLPVIFWLVGRTLYHKRSCLVKIVGDV